MSKVFEEIYNNYKIMIYNYFYKSTLNRAVSEELTQDTFMKSFKYFPSFKGESNIKTWLFKIARNTFLTYINKKSKFHEDCLENHSLTDSENKFDNIHDKLVIKKILLKLSEEERTLIILRDLNQFTYKDIAKIMNFTEGKVKIGLHRARKKFKEYYNTETERSD